MSYCKGITITYSDIIEYVIYGRRNSFPDIEKVIFNGPATIVMWSDGTKTVVKCQEGDEYSKQTGLLMCVFKKAFGAKNDLEKMLNKLCSVENVKLQIPFLDFNVDDEIDKFQQLSEIRETAHKPGFVH